MSARYHTVDMNTPTPEQARGSVQPGPRAAIATVARLVGAAVAVTLALGGCGKPAPATDAAPAKPTQASWHRVTAAVDEASAQFMAFALNALLVPLFDDDVPPRWADPSLSFDCDAGAVTVDDAPLDIGAPVPRQPFTVRWHMERCAPFDDAMDLSGDIELRVEPSGAGYRAVVQPARFHIVSAHGHEVLTQAFTASMGLGR